MARKTSKSGTRKTPKSAKTSDTPKDVAEDTPVDETTIEAEAVDVTEDDPEAKPEEAPQESADASDDTPEPDVSVQDAPVPVAPQAETVVVRKGGFVPMVLGGLVAGAIGFGAAIYLLPELPESWLPAKGTSETTALKAQIEAQAAEIDALEAAMANIGGSDALDAAIADVSGKIDGLSSDVAALKDSAGAVAELEARLTELEKAPLANASPAAVEAYQREMAQLQEAIAAQRAEVEAMAAKAAEERESAEMTAQDALKRSALSQILTSLETGTAFGEAVESLSAAGVDVPEALGAQSGGVPSIADLSEQFPDVARAALAAARSEDAGEGGGGLGAFLKTQLGARSLEPREGDDPDAVLSRMEAAAREGRFGDVAAEAEALPDAARAPLQDWLDAAEARRAATEAAEALSQQINSN